ncbi:leucine-rich repeat domain-containing protein [Porticoccaceae bacterium]|nr:leucine-rich repeat domain-containing protein [Porticoccaceae bacterium]MDA8682270.1 leucine-rich repeat domain-containing protein [Porticoccaceae bacterium]MDA8788887.1 leucine-rich repeat domain-containing protein [Porticoccaceae bacterium]MDB2343797.1 leucine-rich repeat domain-containing protein [Porticoccaceae bacterium]
MLTNVYLTTNSVTFKKVITSGPDIGIQYQLKSSSTSNDVYAIICGRVDFTGEDLTRDLVLPSMIKDCQVIEIAEGAFDNNELDSVFLPDGLTSIRENAFSNNTLHNVSFPDSIEFIAPGAFKNNPKLKGVLLPGHSFDSCAHGFDSHVDFQTPVCDSEPMLA